MFDLSEVVQEYIDEHEGEVADLIHENIISMVRQEVWDILRKDENARKIISKLIQELMDQVLKAAVHLIEAESKGKRRPPKKDGIKE